MIYRGRLDCRNVNLDVLLADVNETVFVSEDSGTADDLWVVIVFVLFRGFEVIILLIVLKGEDCIAIGRGSTSRGPSGSGSGSNRLSRGGFLSKKLRERLIVGIVLWSSCVSVSA